MTVNNVVTECCFSPFLTRDSKKLLIVSNHSVTYKCSKCDGAMSQQSAGIKAIHNEQKRYFCSLTFTVW